MLRASVFILLSCALVPAMAQNGRASQTGNGTACQDIADKAAESSVPGTAAGRTKAVVRNKYSVNTTPVIPNVPAPTTRGGGDDGDASAPVLPRPRGPKWHSFLPGMFR